MSADGKGSMKPMKRYLLLLPWIGAAAAAYFLLRGRLPEFADWLKDKGALGAVLVGSVYALATVLLVPAAPLTLAIGFLYGPLAGTAIVSPASVLGATAAFLLGRTLLRKPLERKFGRTARFRALDAAIERNGLRILVLTRLSPIFPFVVLNYLFGLTRLPLLPYVLGSFLAMLPGTFLYVYLGSTVQDASQLLSGGASGGTLVTVAKFAGIAATLAVTVYIAHIARKALRGSAPGLAKPGGKD